MDARSFANVPRIKAFSANTLQITAGFCRVVLDVCNAFPAPALALSVAYLAAGAFRPNRPLVHAQRPYNGASRTCNGGTPAANYP